MTWATRQRRSCQEIHADRSGQMAVEWVLVTTVVLIPLGMLVPLILQMIQTYFYRVAGVMCFPFP